LKRIGLVILTLVGILLQLGFLPALRPFGVVPNILLVIVVLVGLEATSSQALAIAVCAGLATDLASGANFGLWTGLLVVAALATGLLHRAGLELSGPLVAMVLVACGTLLETLVILLGLVNAVSGWPVGLLLVKFCTELVLNLVLVLALKPVTRLVLPSGDPGVAVIG
jgi:rod shape-determining protein MreD